MKEKTIDDFCEELTQESEKHSSESGFYSSSINNVVIQIREYDDFEELQIYIENKLDSLQKERNSAVKMWTGSGCSVGGHSIASNMGEYYGTQIKGYSKAQQILTKYLPDKKTN